MKFKELKSMDNETLNKKLHEIRADLMKENAQVAIGTIPKSPGKLRLLKRTVARINTLLNKSKGAQKNK